MTTRLFRLLGVVLVLAALAYPLRAMAQQDRSAYLDWMLKSLPSAPQFAQWQQRTGELPPDFEAFPRNNFLPDPLTFMDGRAVRNASDWSARRTEIRQLLERWQVGSVPPKATTFKTTVQSETQGNGYTTRVVAIDYGPQADKTTTVTVTLTIPQGPGPFPVMIGGAAASLIRRGYIACSYTGTVDAPGAIATLYPEHDFASMGQVAFTLQTVVDLQPVLRLRQAHAARTRRLHAPDRCHAGRGGTLDESDLCANADGGHGKMTGHGEPLAGAFVKSYRKSPYPIPAATPDRPI